MNFQKSRDNDKTLKTSREEQILVKFDTTQIGIKFLCNNSE